MKKLVIAAAMTLVAAVASASDYPNKPIRLIVPLAAGGGGDVAARLVANELSGILGQNVIVENKAGASSMIGTSYAAKSDPDGYTLLFVTDFHSINEAMNRLGKLQGKLPYDSFKDFETVGQVLDLQIALLASQKSGIKSMRELSAKAKAMNGGMSAGMLGEGSPHYLAFLNMQQMGGYKLIEVPYGGSGPATVAVQAGEVDLAFSTVGAGLQMEKSNRVTALAVSGPARDPLAPNIPTIAESGYPGFSIQSWMGILAPKGVSQDKLQLLNTALNKALAAPELVKKIKAAGMYPAPKSREQFTALIAQEADKVERIYKNAKK
ncbi:Bug family tripartite tricarboxylate transporter substrate binding protein [Polaromonas sp.]|uniref:Bug family tripartite tricarboxylate transporter substrate binding protein n=1 Tax=Polaromonas sp. TaxID=1869339 RepID=UPI003BAD6E64